MGIKFSSNHQKAGSGGPSFLARSIALAQLQGPVVTEEMAQTTKQVQILKVRDLKFCPKNIFFEKNRYHPKREFGI